MEKAGSVLMMTMMMILRQKYFAVYFSNKCEKNSKKYPKCDTSLYHALLRTILLFFLQSHKINPTKHTSI